MKEYMPYLLIAVIILSFGGCSVINKYFGLTDDNIAEEIVEQVIEQKTGLDLDLTPENKE